MSEHDRAMLQRAALAGLRGEGRVEPNPAVGCLIGREEQGGVRVLGIGHHRVFGGPHAEIEALDAARRRGATPDDLRGATAWVTLEPCAHSGKTPPCTEALIAAGLARVVYARSDPNPLASGGAERLRAAGIRAECSGICAMASRLADPFIKRVTTGMPWVIAKWAQTIDGRVADRAGRSQWISGDASRRLVHRWRGRAGAIMVGIGTARADDPWLTVRGVPARRTPHRVVVDPELELSPDSALAKSAADVPLLVAGCAGAAGLCFDERAARLRERGAQVLVVPQRAGLLSLGDLLVRLWSAFQIHSVIAEGGPGLIGRLLEADLVDECRVFTAGLMLEDHEAPGAVRAARRAEAPTLAGAKRFELVVNKRVGGDALSVWRRLR